MAETRIPESAPGSGIAIPELEHEDEDAVEDARKPPNDGDIFSLPYLPTGPLATILTLPLQALAIFLLSQVAHQIVRSIDEVYEATGRRARSQFSGLPWIRITIGLVLMFAYHVGLFRLAKRSYRALRLKGAEEVAEG